MVTFIQIENTDSSLITFDTLEELDWVRRNVVVRRSKYEERIWVGASDLEQEGTWR